MKTEPKLKIAWMAIEPATYREKALDFLESRMAVQFDRLYLKPFEQTRGYEWVEASGRVLPSRGPNLFGDVGRMHGLWKEVLNPRTCDLVVIGGYARMTFLAALRHAREVGIPSIMHWESHGERHLSSIRESVKRRLGANYLSYPGAFLATSSKAANYLESLGVARQKLCVFPSAPVPLTGDRKNGDRASGLAVLFVGRLVSEKGPDTLLRAWRIVENSQSESLPTLRMLGAGPLEGDLRSLAAELRLKRVEFLGAQSPEETLAAYQNADIFVLPSRYEPYGVAVHEALLAGLPAIATTAVGCAGDVLQHGINGLVIAPDDPKGLAESLLKLVNDEETRRSLALRAPQLANQWGYSKMEAGLTLALSQVY